MAKILTIRLPESVYERVEEAANEEGLLVSEYLRDLIRDAFAEEAPKAADSGDADDQDEEETRDEDESA